jgi:hypothetical protein
MSKLASPAESLELARAGGLRGKAVLRRQVTCDLPWHAQGSNCGAVSRRAIPAGAASRSAVRCVARTTSWSARRPPAAATGFDHRDEDAERSAQMPRYRSLPRRRP